MIYYLCSSFFLIKRIKIQEYKTSKKIGTANGLAAPKQTLKKTFLYINGIVKTPNSYLHSLQVLFALW